MPPKGPDTKKHKSEENLNGCFFCGKSGHKKQDCAKYANWRVNKGTSLTLVCSEVNLSSLPRKHIVDRLWCYYSHMCFYAGLPPLSMPNDAERLIYVGNDESGAS